MSAKPIAIVTGASSGIGAASAKLLAENGFKVYACARRLEKLVELSKFNSGIEAISLDVTSQESVNSLVELLGDSKVEILVNCAGGALDFATVLESDPETWNKTYDLNVTSVVRMVKAITPLMIKNQHGTIVIISSTAGHTAYENGGTYVGAKFGEVALARTLRLELSGQPIRVIEIAPGMVKTDEFAKN